MRVYQQFQESTNLYLEERSFKYELYFIYSVQQLNTDSGCEWLEKSFDMP